MGSHYNKLRPKYEQLWSTMKINPGALGEVDRIAKAMFANKARYEPVSQASGVPWFVIGTAHNMEGNMNFSKHLHNGDPLTAKTKLVPPGRPPGNPPFTWEVSAVDAMTLKSKEWKAQAPGWSIPEMIYKLESYNGFGYHSKGINSPYLWAKSNHWTKGKYTRDNYFDPNAGSAQTGVMVVIRRMMELGMIDPNSIANAGPITSSGDASGCIDPGAAGSTNLSQMNPQSAAEALAYVLGLNERRKQSHEFKAVLNPASDPTLLNLDIQKTFELFGIAEDLDGTYTCDDVIITLGSSGLEIELTAYRPDPNAPASQIFVSGGGAPANPGNAAPGASVPAGDINSRIFQAAQQTKGASSRSGPGGGSIACAWCLNTLVFPKAGIKPIGDAPNAVDSVEAALKGGRGQAIVPRSQAKPGDIVVMGRGGPAHIGIAMNDGGTQTLSNSSSKKIFAWVASMEEYDKHYPVPCRVYRVLN